MLFAFNRNCKLMLCCKSTCCLSMPLLWWNCLCVQSQLSCSFGRVLFFAAAVFHEGRMLKAQSVCLPCRGKENFTRVPFPYKAARLFNGNEQESALPFVTSQKGFLISFNKCTAIAMYRSLRIYWHKWQCEKKTIFFFCLILSAGSVFADASLFAKEPTVCLDEICCTGLDPLID